VGGEDDPVLAAQPPAGTRFHDYQST